MEVTVATDVTAADEPLLALVRESGEKYINKFITYPTTGGNADELALIGKMCKSARELTEKELNMSLAEKTITVFYSLDDVKEDKFKMKLPYGPHSSITSVHINYSDGSTATALTENTDYYLSGDQYKTIHLPMISGTVGVGAVSGYKIVLVAGFGAASCETIPEAIRMLMASQFTQWYAKRDGIWVLSHEMKKALQQFTKKLWV